MIRKTQAIVLNTVRYGETSLITTLYTRDFGRQSFIVKGARSPKARRKHSYFQPMSQIEIVYFYKETRDLQIITENQSLHFYHHLHTDPVRIALGLVMTEVFYQSVREHEENQPLYQFYSDCLLDLDRREQHLVHVFLYFLMHLSGYLGFLPQVALEDADAPVFFDTAEGSFRTGPIHRPADRMLLDLLLAADTDAAAALRFDNVLKRDMISQLLQFYRLHVEGFRTPASIEVFADVFA